MVVILIWIALLSFATARAITTALNKTFEAHQNGYTEYERLIFLEDAEHWWTAVVINALLLSIGVVQLIAPPLPPGVESVFEHPAFTWHYDYSTVVSLIFAALLNIRIERHGWYYRKREGINILGRDRSEGLWTSFKRMFFGRRSTTTVLDQRGKGQDVRGRGQDERGERQDQREREQDERERKQDEV